MGYRDITVDGTDYQYTVGKTHVKIRGMQAVLKEDVGHIENIERICGCCGTALSELYPDEPEIHFRRVLSVQPHDIADYIRKNVPA